MGQKSKLPHLPQEIWDIIYKIKHELEDGSFCGSWG